MRIGELAAAVGVSTRTIRHYHRVGLLPEPAREANGYRSYGLRDLLRLTRARRLVELGLSLEEAADAVADDEGRELVEILADVDADLARQEAEIRRRRQRLAELLARARDGRLDADHAVSPATADLIARIGEAFPDSPTARRDREYLALLDGQVDMTEVAERFGRVLADAQALARTTELYRRFDELADAPPDDPRVDGLARDLVGALAIDVELAGGEVDQPFGAAFVGDFPPGQAAVVRRVVALLERS
jgi:DNA-binding transcriptional MerR regulator